MWHFCYLNDEKTISTCRLCKQTWKYTAGLTGGSTGGLKRHLFKKHKKEWYAYLYSIGVNEDNSVVGPSGQTWFKVN